MDAAVVQGECLITAGRILATGSVVKERFGTCGRVVGASVGLERIPTDCCIVTAATVFERQTTLSRVAVIQVSVLCSSHLQKSKGSQGDRDQ